jgi:hypothetical protein
MVGSSMNTNPAFIGEVKVGIQGFMKFDLLKAVLDEDGNQMYDEDGHAMAYEETRREVAPWFPNLILTNARNQMSDFSGWAGQGSKAQVGTNGAAPTSGEQGLIAWIAGTPDQVAISNGAESSEPWYKWDQRTYRFASDSGITGQILQEAGVGWDVVNGPNLTSRALIVNALGAATPIVPALNEILDMTYQIRYYPPLVDVEGQVTLNGVLYNTVFRACDVNGAPSDDSIGKAFGVSGSAIDWSAYEGTLGALNDPGPNGLSAPCDNNSQFNLGYSNNSYSIDMQCDCGVSGWNLAGDIQCLRIPTTAFWFQCSFLSDVGDLPIPKDINFTMSFTWRVSWAALNWAYAWDMEAADDVTTPTSAAWNTNLAETLLRINWTAGAPATGSRQFDLQVETGTTFRIIDNTDTTKWVEYTTQLAYVEGADWTEYAVIQTDIQNSGPTVGNACLIKAVIF